MSQGSRPDSGQRPDIGLREIPFENLEAFVFLSEEVGELIEELSGRDRGIGWAITLLRAGDCVTLVSGSASSLAVDEVQTAFDDGPSRAAVRSGEFVHLGDTRLDRRWPGYASTAAGMGFRSVLSVPLVPASVFRAALNLYAGSPHVFTSADITAARRSVRHVSRALRLAAQRQTRGKEYGEGLSSAQLTRTLAGLALRTLVREHGFSVEASLEYLRRAAGNLPQTASGPSVVVVGDSDSGGADPRHRPDLRAARNAKSRAAHRMRHRTKKSA